MTLFLFALALLALCFFHYVPTLKARWAYRKWATSLKLNEHATVYKKVFDAVNGFELSRQARLAQDAPEYLYGEIDFFGFIALLSLEKPTSKTIFYDLGSGVGKAVFASMMVYDVQKSCGIELFPSLHQAAIQQKQVLSKIQGYEQKASKIALIQGHFLHIDFSEATYIFINGTTFVSEIWESISQRVDQSHASIVISTSKPIKSAIFYVFKKLTIPMSWGNATVFIQKRKQLMPIIQSNSSSAS